MKLELYDSPEIKAALIIYPNEFHVIKHILEPYHEKNIPRNSSPHPFSALATHLLSPKFNVDEPKRLMIEPRHFSRVMDGMHGLAVEYIGSLLALRKVLTPKPAMLQLNSFPDDEEVLLNDSNFQTDPIIDVEIEMLDDRIIYADFIASQFANPDGIDFDLD